MRIDTGAVVTSRRRLSGVERGQRSLLSMERKGQCSRGDQCSFRHDSDERAKPTPNTAPPSEPPTQRGRCASRTMSLRGRSPSGKFARLPCRDYPKGICTNSPCDDWHPSESQFYKSESGCTFGEKCSFPHRKARNNQIKSRHSWVVYFRTQSRQNLHRFYGRAQQILGPIRRVRFTKAALRQANIRENKGPSLNKLQVKLPHQCSPCVVKLEDRSQEERERQERCARGDAWKLAKNICKLKEAEKAAFFSRADKWIMRA